MLSSSLDTLLKVSKTTSPQTLFSYDCVTLYILLLGTTPLYVDPMESPTATSVYSGSSFINTDP